MLIEEKSTEKEKADQKKVETTFLFLGIGSLLAFNAYLSQFFFFKSFLPNHKPDEVFTSIDSGLNLSILILFQIFGAFISYTKQLILFQLFSLVSLIFAPFVVIYLDESVSYLICYFLFACSGVAKALANSSVFALASFYPLACVVNVGVGQGIAGILSNILGFATSFLFRGEGVDNVKKGAYLYFLLSAGIILVCLYFSFGLFKNDFFMEIAIKNGIVKGIVEKDENENKNDVELAMLEEEPQKEQKVKEEEVGFFTLVKKIFMTNIMMFLFFFTLFAVFPGALIKTDLFGFNFGTKINTILLIFNISDTIGRKLGGKVDISMKNIYMVMFSRVILIVSILFNIYGEKTQLLGKYVVYILTILNPALLAISNGIGCSLCFAIAPSQVEKKLAGRAGSCVSFFLVVGLFFGSLSSMSVQTLTDSFGK